MKDEDSGRRETSVAGSKEKKDTQSPGEEAMVSMLFTICTLYPAIT